MSRNDKYKTLINSATWRRLRSAHLKAHPLCERCWREGKVTAATEVHHIIPVETMTTLAGMSRLAYDERNIVSLCHDCHVREHKEMNSHGKETNRQRQAAKLADFVAKFKLNL